MKRSDRGQSLVEFALVLPILLAVAFIITEFGRALWIKNLMTQAANQAARAAIVDGTGNWQSSAKDAANKLLSPLGMEELTDLDHFRDSTGVDADGTRYVLIRITETFHFIPRGPLPTTPSGKPVAGKPSTIPLGAIKLVATATMDAQPNFQP
jgi:Flp pilus assembly protein TadG